jgi:hypothetical protein
MSSAGTAWGITEAMARDVTDKIFLGIPSRIFSANASNTRYTHNFVMSAPRCLTDGFCAGIKCRAEFCWSCLNDYNAIRKLGNSEHKPTCEFHSDNLPDISRSDISV